MHRISHIMFIWLFDYRRRSMKPIAKFKTIPHQALFLELSLDVVYVTNRVGLEELNEGALSQSYHI